VFGGVVERMLFSASFSQIPRLMRVVDSAVDNSHHFGFLEKPLPHL
jgi:hypothetical protein